MDNSDSHRIHTVKNMTTAGKLNFSYVFNQQRELTIFGTLIFRNGFENKSKSKWKVSGAFILFVWLFFVAKKSSSGEKKQKVKIAFRKWVYDLFRLDFITKLLVENVFKALELTFGDLHISVQQDHKDFAFEVRMRYLN